MLHYKNSKRIGLRKKTGLKRQLASFGSKLSKEEDLRTLAEECLIKLGQGEEHAQVKDWAQKKVKQLAC